MGELRHITEPANAELHNGEFLTIVNGKATWGAKGGGPDEYLKSASLSDGRLDITSNGNVTFSALPSAGGRLLSDSGKTILGIGDASHDGELVVGVTNVVEEIYKRCSISMQDDGVWRLSDVLVDTTKTEVKYGSDN